MGRRFHNGLGHAHRQGVRAIGLVVHALAKKPDTTIHARLHELPNGVTLADSYHCSRYNTNTGRLTTAMFHDVFDKIREALGG